MIAIDELQNLFFDTNDRDDRDDLNNAMSHVRWTPMGEPIGYNSYLHQKKNVHVSGFEMSLCLFNPWLDFTIDDPNYRVTEKSLLKWVYISQSSIPPAGLGLFSCRTFKVGAIISVYCAVKGDPKNKTVYGMNLGTLFIDPAWNSRSPPLLLGAHFANDRDWVPRRRAVTPRAVNKKSNNAKFVGLRLIAIKEIRPRVEICVGYGY